MTEFPGGDPLSRARLGRRSVLRGAGAALLATPLLAACGGGQTAADQDHSDKEHVLAISNRPGFIDKTPPTGTLKPVKAPSIARFAAGSHIAVKYHEDITDDEQYFAKAKDALAAGTWMERDLIVLPGWLAAQAATAKLALKFDHLSTQTLRNLAEPFQSSLADPQRDYTIPWVAGITGIAYDSKAVEKPVRTVEQLLTAPSLRGKVTGLTSMRDTLGLILAQLGKDPEAATSADVSAALAKLESAVRSGQFLRFTGPEYVGDLISGRALAGIASSLDVPKLKKANPAIEFVVPEAGGILWSRDAFLASGARHQKNAEQLINYYFTPLFAAQFAASLQHVCVVDGAREEMADLKPALVGNPLIFPDAALLARLSMFVQLDDKTSATYSAAYRGVIGG